MTSKVARKTHLCTLCEKEIREGEKYRYQRITPWDHPDNSTFSDYRAHSVCDDFWQRVGEEQDWIFLDPADFREALTNYLNERVTWTMFAHEYTRNGDVYFMHIGTLTYVRAHFLREPIFKVEVEAHKTGRYYGWIDSDKDTPTMIWPNKQQFSMCFTYGYEAAEAKGKGRMVRLSIKKIEEIAEITYE